MAFKLGAPRLALITTVALIVAFNTFSSLLKDPTATRASGRVISALPRLPLYAPTVATPAVTHQQSGAPPGIVRGIAPIDEPPPAAPFSEQPPSDSDMESRWGRPSNEIPLRSPNVDDSATAQQSGARPLKRPSQAPIARTAEGSSRTGRTAHDPGPTLPGSSPFSYEDHLLAH